LAAEIEEETGILVDIIPGEPHQFDVFLEGDIIFSSKDAKRLPQSAEIIKIIRQKEDVQTAEE